MARVQESIEVCGIETGQWRASIAQGDVDHAVGGSDNELPR
ncbi:MAG: hypothetical protein ABWX85_11430 [Arthrobacter sp.]